MPQYINPRVSIAFTKIFGVKENEDLLLSLINSIVDPADQVSELTLLNPYGYKSFYDDGCSTLDIKALGKTGEQYNIEIQLTDKGDYDQRALYNWAKRYTEKLKTKENYVLLDKAIVIHILYFDFLLETDVYHHRLHIVKRGKGFFKDLALHTIELKKFSKNIELKEFSNNIDEDLEELLKNVKTSLDRWMGFLNHPDLLNPGNLLYPDDLPAPLAGPDLEKALHVLQVMHFTSAESELYEGQLKWLRMTTSVLRKQKEKGREQGLQESGQQGLQIDQDQLQAATQKGEEKGLQWGVELGLAKGRQEERMAIVKNLLSMGYRLDEVAKMIG